MLKPLVIGDLVAKVPIIQGGMGVGISLSSLAGAVAKEGGIGVISTAQIGFLEEDFRSNTLEANMHAIRKHILKARELAPSGILGVNIMVATRNYARYVKEAVDAGIDIIISGAGLPLELPKLVKGSKTKIIPIISSLRAAKLILRMWFEKDHVLPDAVIIEGPLAGGHLGFKAEELEHIDSREYDIEIKSMISYIDEFALTHGGEIPVITAGGIDCKETFLHQFELGASGVQIATKFVTTNECDAHENFKNAYLKAREEDIVIVKSPVGMPGRAIKNSFVKKVQEERIPPVKCSGCIISCKPENTQYCITDALINAATGDMDNALIFCGAKTYLENEIRSVKEVIEEFIL